MQIERLGRYPAAKQVIAHVSDTHLLRGGAPLGGAPTPSGRWTKWSPNSPAWATPSTRSW